MEPESDERQHDQCRVDVVVVRCRLPCSTRTLPLLLRCLATITLSNPNILAAEARVFYTRQIRLLVAAGVMLWPADALNSSTGQFRFYAGVRIWSADALAFPRKQKPK